MTIPRAEYKEEIDTHIIVINYIAKMERENTALKAENARLLSALADYENNFEGC